MTKYKAVNRRIKAIRFRITKKDIKVIQRALANLPIKCDSY